MPDSAQNLVFSTVSGEKIPLTSGKGPMLVYFWSTSCVICIKEMPELAAFYERFAARGLEMVAVAMPYDPPNTVVEFTSQQRLPFPVAIDIQGEALNTFASVKGTPTTFLLDTDRRLTHEFIGKVHIDKLERNVTRLLGES